MSTSVWNFGDTEDALSGPSTKAKANVSCCFIKINIHVGTDSFFFLFRFGPFRQHWCMRFESKNAQIKRFVSSSFRNVPLTVAIHHQQWICPQLATHPNQSTV